MISDSLPQKPVLITGASTGIGKETARYLDDLGFQVFAGVRKEKDGDAIRENGHQSIMPVILDVTRKEDIESAVQFIERQTGPKGLLGLVNNAGIPVGGPMEFISLDQVRRVMEVNLLGVISVIQSFLPLIRKGNGRIVNISSISGRIALPFVGPYAASKFALEAISDALRVELKPWKIPVILIEPGDVSTPIWEKAAETINETVTGFPKAAYDQYGPVFEMINSIKTHGIPANHVAKKIHKALTVKWPKARYLVGADARIFSLIARLPPFIRDAVIRRFIPEYGNAQEKTEKKATAP